MEDRGIGGGRPTADEGAGLALLRVEWRETSCSEDHAMRWSRFPEC